jgi:hypothetical protein
MDSNSSCCCDWANAEKEEIKKAKSNTGILSSDGKESLNFLCID